MTDKKKRLTICSFPTPFDGEAAYYELGLIRISQMESVRWKTVKITLDKADPEALVKKVMDTEPDVVVLHVYRDRVLDGINFTNTLGQISPGLPLIWCGWTAHPPYLDAVSSATYAFTHPSLVLACGEVEAVIPPLLSRMLQGNTAIDDLVDIKGVVLWDSREKSFKGTWLFSCVENLAVLPSSWDEDLPRYVQEVPAGWIEILRGCLYSCSFCIGCSFGERKIRKYPPERIRSEIKKAHSKGVKLFGLLAASINYDAETLKTVAETLKMLPGDDHRVAGTIHAKFAKGERFELLSSMKWNRMIVGIQTITPEAQRLMNRHENPEQFAKTIEKLASLTVPEIEMIVGLPGDTPEGFRETINWALSLPADISVYRLRLDPWSRYLVNRHELGIKADFSRMGRVVKTPGFSDGEINDCESWLRRLCRKPWHYRAGNMYLDGEILNKQE